VSSRIAWISIAFVVALAAVAVAAAEPIPRWIGSWADGKHVWTTRDADSWAQADPLCDANLCGTENGGATWHPLLRAQDGHFQRVVRTSATAGVVRAVVNRPLSSDPYWTPDAGRHWFRTSRIGGTLSGGIGSFQLGGNGRYLYWHRGGKVLYRVVPWPPRGTPECSGGEWRLDLTAGGTPPPGSWGAICVGPAVDAGMRDIAAVRLTTGSFPLTSDLVSIRRGVASLLYPVVRRRPKLLVVQSGTSRVLRLPRPPAWRRTKGLKGYRLHQLGWPNLGISAEALGPTPLRTDTIGCVIWRSRNGGRSWAVHTVDFNTAPFPYCK